MVIRAHLLPFFLALLLGGCPDGDPRPDAAPDRGGDSSREAGSLGDLSMPSDLTLPSVCELRCLDQGLHLCLTDPGNGQCVECTEDAHCLANPGALGSRCDIKTRRCTCSGHSDCAKNLRGPICDAVKKICTCKTSAQCNGPFPLCGGSGDAKTCVRPCVADTHCQDPGAPRCQTSTGRCVACLADNHCAGHPDGAHCDGHNACVCALDKHCQLPSAWGSQCVEIGQHKRCGCVTHSDCPINQHGPVCDVDIQRCTCTSDDLCTISPYTRCAVPHAGASYRQCRAPCKGDKDCEALPGLPRCVSGSCTQCTVSKDCPAARPHCDTKLHRCGQCLTDSHCSQDAPYCDPVQGRCSQCKSHGDCSSSLAGGTCIGGSCGCTSDKDCKGPLAWGSTCHPVLRRCSCANDVGCKGVSSGPLCDHTLHKCICKSSAQCKAPHIKCALPYLTAAYSHCQKPCKTDVDCAGKIGLSRCNPMTGTCLPCLTDTDCAARPFAKICEVTAAIRGCVQCQQDSHCGAAALGPKCSTTEGACYCSDSAQCAANLNGQQCHQSLQICSCLKDTDCPKGRTCKGTSKSLGVLLCK